MNLEWSQYNNDALSNISEYPYFHYNYLIKKKKDRQQIIRIKNNITFARRRDTGIYSSSSYYD